jgi:hypothetical protein
MNVLLRRLIEVHAAIRAVVGALLPKWAKCDVSRKGIEPAFAPWALGPCEKQRANGKDGKGHHHRPWGLVFHRDVAKSAQRQWDAKPREKHREEDEPHSAPKTVVNCHGFESYQPGALGVAT